MFYLLLIHLNLIQNYHATLLYIVLQTSVFLNHNIKILLKFIYFNKCVSIVMATAVNEITIYLPHSDKLYHYVIEKNRRN